MNNPELIEENARLLARVRSLEYEVEMLTQLVKNIIYAKPNLEMKYQRETDS
jgi:hypothetical protein